jgi:hypothetical protein
MKSVKDTVDKYINAKLNTQKNGLNNITCFDDYQLTIGTNGKLKKVEVSNHHKMKFENLLNLRDYLADKREIRRCKTKIREIFKEIDLSFLNLKYELYRTLSFDMKRGFQLGDNTQY